MSPEFQALITQLNELTGEDLAAEFADILPASQDPADLHPWARRHIDQAIADKEAAEDFEACASLVWYRNWLATQPH